jgi:site-specific recombinase XerD
MNELKCLSKHEIQQLVERVSGNRNRLLLRVLYETGCQVHELVAIRRRDVRPDDSRVIIAGRSLHISPKTVSLLEEQATMSIHGPYLFSTRQSSCMTKKRVRQIIQSTSKDVLGKKVSPQTIRYSHIAHALQNGVKLEELRERVGLARLRAKQLAKAFERAP